MTDTERSRRSTYLVIAAVSMVLALTGSFAEPRAAEAQRRATDQVPSELWKAYPLDPSKGRATLRPRKDAEEERAPSPTLTETGVRPATETGAARREPVGAGGRDSGVVPRTQLIVLTVLGALLLVLLSLPIARVVPSVPTSLARAGPHSCLPPAQS
jgi:hypothetical protein